jgi:outer membrane protein assembly factor BamB
MVVLTVVSVFSVVLPAMAAGQEDAQAQKVLDLAGVKNGLCVHLGCGRENSLGLTAGLAAGSKMLVHGIALDDASLARARKAVEKKGVLGQATVEKLSVEALPHVRDLANLVVIEDFEALAAKGLKMSEVERIVAPGGTICTLKGSSWSKEPKQRPKEMDDWTHPQHGPDGNRVSNDKLVQFPVGLRWQDGVPMNFNLWAACRGWVIAGGRCFTLSTTEAENLAPLAGTKHKEEEWVSARDAFNGLPLWKVNCKTTNDGKYLNAWNPAPLVADAERVYVYQGDSLVALDAATGKVAKGYAVKYPSARLLLAQNILVSAGWEAKEEGKEPGPQGLWAPWVAKTKAGAVEAFDAQQAKPKWSLPVAAQEMLFADGTLYLLVQTGNPAKEQQIVAVDIETGKERWKLPHTQFTPQPGLHFAGAGQGVLIVARTKAKVVTVLSAADGKKLWEIPSSENPWTPIVDGLVWHGDKKYDPKTGEVKGKLPRGIHSPVCTPGAVAGNIVTDSRGCGYIEFPDPNDAAAKGAKWIRYGGARGGCIEGAVPACGMFYTSQNNCRCAPGQVQGFVGFGPCGKEPTAADFEQERPLEKGPAFGAVKPAAPTGGDWPMFLHDASRSGATKAKLPQELATTWQAEVCKPADGPLADAWKARLVSCLSAPVVAEGLLFAAATEANQVVALDAADGKPAWRFTAGARIDTPPTIYQGLCFFGCHDGWLYALCAKDGKLAWRVRVAPAERRMVAFGQVESVWPAIGSVLIHDGKVYATAGRTTESDGGLALCSFEPPTGKQIWANLVGAGPNRVNDMLALDGGKLALHHIRIDPQTGKHEIAKDARSEALDGTMDGTWTRLGTRRSGNLTFGRARGEMFAANEDMVYGCEAAGRACYAVPRVKTLPTKGLAPDKDRLDAKEHKWRFSLPGNHQAEAMAVAGNGLVLAGRAWDPKENKVSGFLWVVGLENGKRVLELPLDAPPGYQGIAVTEGRIHVALQNGKVACLGK